MTTQPIRLKLYVYPLEGTHCGYGVQQGVLLPALDHIPGRVMRGGLAGWAVRNKILQPEDPKFQQFFLARQEAGETLASFPCCTLLGRDAVSCSCFESKGRSEHPATTLLGDHGLKLIDDATTVPDMSKALGPVDFLTSPAWPAERDASLKPCRGTMDMSGEYHPPFPTVLEMKSAHDSQKGRVDENGLHIVEVLPANPRKEARATYYAGDFVLAGEAREIFSKLLLRGRDVADLSDDEILDPGPDHLIFIGRKKTPAAVFAVESKAGTDHADTTAHATEVAITLTSSLIPEVETKYRMSWELLAATLGIKVTDQEKRAFCRTTQVHGMSDGDRGSGTPYTRDAFAAGTCLRITAPTAPKEIERLLRLSLFGAGLHSRDGHGRFRMQAKQAAKPQSSNE